MFYFCSILSVFCVMCNNKSFTALNRILMILDQNTLLYFQPRDEEPSVTTEQASTIAIQPSVVTEQPSTTTEHHFITTKHPSITTEHSLVSTEHPSVTTEHRVVTTKHPVVTTEHSVVTTKHHVVTTEYIIGNYTITMIYDRSSPSVITKSMLDFSWETITISVILVSFILIGYKLYKKTIIDLY